MSRVIALVIGVQLLAVGVSEHEVLFTLGFTVCGSALLTWYSMAGKETAG